MEMLPKTENDNVTPVAKTNIDDNIKDINSEDSSNNQLKIPAVFEKLFIRGWFLLFIAYPFIKLFIKGQSNILDLTSIMFGFVLTVLFYCFYKYMSNFNVKVSHLKWLYLFFGIGIFGDLIVTIIDNSSFAEELLILSFITGIISLISLILYILLSIYTALKLYNTKTDKIDNKYFKPLSIAIFVYSIGLFISLIIGFTLIFTQGEYSDSSAFEIIWNVFDILGEITISFIIYKIIKDGMQFNKRIKESLTSVGNLNN